VSNKVVAKIGAAHRPRGWKVRSNEHKDVLQSVRVDPDEKLVLGAKCGDADCVEALFKKYRDRINGLTTRMCPREQDAENLTQEILVHAMVEKIWQFRGESMFSTWLHSIAVHMTMNFLNRLPEPSIEAPPELSDEGKQSKSLDLKQCLDDALRRLPHEQRLAVILHYLEGNTLEETADIIGVPLAAAKSMSRGGVERLRRLMKERTRS
jgi:RNA polymerase sigma-70 factor (ECF subfamily)